jgi:hypothetical protein
MFFTRQSTEGRQGAFRVEDRRQRRRRPGRARGKVVITVVEES